MSAGVWRLRSGSVVLILLAACSSGGGNGGTGPSPTISLSLSPSSASVVQGGSAQVTGTLTRGGGYTGTVTFSVSGAPAGITASAGPPQSNGSATSVVFTVQVAGSVAPGTYAITVTGQGSGVDPRNATFTITVTEAPDFSLALTPAAASVTQGLSSGEIPLTLTRVNFTGAVTLSLTGAPSGVTAAFTPPAASENSASMTLTVGAAVAPGGYNFQVSGSGAPGTRSADFALTVKAPGSFTLALAPAGAVTIFQGASDNSRTVNITRDDYPAPIVLTAENLPNGVTAAFAGSPVSGSSSVLTLTATGAAAPGNYTITIRGTGPLALRAPGGTLAVEATTTLDVTVAALGSFGISLGLVCPGGLPLAQGALDDSRLIAISRTDFSPGIQLSAENLPDGLTASFAPNPATGNSSRLTLSAGQSVAPGSYNLTIRGTGPAALRVPGARPALDATLSLPVAITAGPAASPSLLEYLFNTGTLEGWAPGATCLDQNQLDWGQVIGQESMVVLNGRGVVENVGLPNSWISKVIALPPNATTLQFDVSGHFFADAGARVRVRILDGTTSTIAYDQPIVGTPPVRVFSTRSVDISPWAGRTIRMFFEQDDNGFKGIFPGVHEQIWLDNIRVLGSLGANWGFRKQIAVATGASAAPTEYSVALQFDHAALVSAGKSLATGNDVRVVFFDGARSFEIDRVLDPGSAWNSGTTTLWFKSQAAIGAGASDNNYFLYYGNSAAGPPPDNRARVFLFHDHFESGTLNKWEAQGLYAADNTQAHGGTFAVKYPSQGNSGNSLFARPALDVADVYLDAWWYVNGTPNLLNISHTVRVRENPYASYIGVMCVACLPGGWWEIGSLINNTYTKLTPEAGTAPANTWFRVGTAIHGTTMRTFVNGALVNIASGLNQIASGNIALGKSLVPGGSSWWVDDVIVRRYVHPEPGLTVGAEQGGPFPAMQWIRR